MAKRWKLLPQRALARLALRQETAQRRGWMLAHPLPANGARPMCGGGLRRAQQERNAPLGRLRPQCLARRDPRWAPRVPTARRR